MELKNVSKIFKTNDKSIVVLDHVSVKFEEGKFYAIVGHSGSGKTTLVNILGLIENISSGDFYIDETNICKLKNNEIANIRRKNIGYIFQDYYLNEYMTALENVMVPMLVSKDISKKERIERAKTLLTEFGLKERINHFPKKLSGGECQRVAIARALVNSPKYLLCDEPTGALDKKNEKKVFDYLKELSKKGICVIVVSHSSEVNKYADIIYEIDEGKISEVKNENK